MKNKCAIIFDLDGTLVDTLDSLYLSVCKMLSRLGLEDISRMQCRDFIGNGVGVLVEKSLHAAGGEGVQEGAMKVFREEFAKYCTHNVKPYDGIMQLLSQLKQKFTLAVLTNKPHAQAIIAVEKMFGKETFAFIQGQVDGEPRKPHPQSILNVVSRLGFDSKNCIFVGDSEVDIQTGKSAGIFTVGVTWGFRDKSVLESERADAIISTPQELLGVIDSCVLLG